jgi:hypothetical protein
MSLRSRSSHRLRALAAVVALVAVGCGNTNPSGAPTPAASGPISSGAAGCATAPQPASDLPGWDVSAQHPTLFPVVISNAADLTCGAVRFMFSFLDKDNLPAAAPDRTAQVAVFNLGRDANTPIATADGTFIWAIEGERGIYVTSLTFPEAGLYGAEFTTAQGSAAPERIRVTFDVQASSSLIKVGQHAPATDNPTVADTGGDVARISTDATPDPALYQATVADTLAAHKPMVVAFATPKFCKTAQCGPTLDRLKPFVTRYPGVTFINVEPYQLQFEDGSLQAVLDASTQDLIPVEATNQWGLISEPWVFVVDRTGIVRGSFGLIFSDAELQAALDAVK